MKSKILLLALGIILAFGSFAYGAEYTDTVQANTGYFVPNDSLKYSSPYYRWWDGDWGWQHGAVGGSFTSATLNLAAFDIDSNSGEVDKVYAYDGLNLVYLGNLTGVNDQWAFGNTFVLDLNLFADDITTGLKVWIDIDATHNYDTWAVTLSKSVLSIDGGQLPDPEPNPTPEPATMLLLGLGLVGVAGLRKRM